MNLKKTLVKLTLGYLAFIMLVSGVLSFTVYTAAQQPLHQRLRLNERIMEEGFLPPPEGRLSQELDRIAVAEVQHNLAVFLIYFNIGVLFLAGIVSYGLAKRELKPLEEAMEMQGRFTSDAAHELRTPLTAMRTEIEVALRGGELDASEARELLESNLEEIARLESLSSSLLKLARYEDEGAGSGEVLPVRKVVGEAVERASKSAAARGVSIANEVPDLRARGDAGSLVELFVILLDNSIKYSDEGTRITLTGRAERSRVQVTVADEGYGIAQEDLARVFDRFYRGSFPAGVKQASGYGLGLSIAGRIAELNRGSIEISSRPGEGTRATVELAV